MKKIICLAVLAFSVMPVFFSEQAVTVIEREEEPTMKEAFSGTKETRKKAKEERDALKAELKRKRENARQEKEAKKKAKADAKQIKESIKAEKFANAKKEIEDIKEERLRVVAEDQAEKAAKKSKTKEQLKAEKKQAKIDKKNAQKESDSVMYAEALAKIEEGKVYKQEMLDSFPKTKDEKLQKKANKTIAKAAAKDDYKKAVRAEYVSLMEKYGLSYEEPVDKNVLRQKEIELIEE